MTAHLIAIATLAAATWAMTGAAGWLILSRATTWDRYFTSPDPLDQFTPDPDETTPLYEALIREWPLIDACTVVVNQTAAAFPSEVETWLRETT